MPGFACRDSCSVRRSAGNGGIRWTATICKGIILLAIMLGCGGPATEPESQALPHLCGWQGCEVVGPQDPRLTSGVYEMLTCVGLGCWYVPTEVAADILTSTPPRGVVGDIRFRDGTVMWEVVGE